jgi:hypothetical protein
VELEAWAELGNINYDWHRTGKEDQTQLNKGGGGVVQNLLMD